MSSENENGKNHRATSTIQKSNADVISYCEQNKIKLTPLRESILLVLLDIKQPLTAYQVLDELKKDNPKAQVMSVYRVLEYLITNHLIHRIENLNAFMPCSHLMKKHVSQWLICQKCGDAMEYALSVFEQGIKDIEENTGFLVTNPTIELIGLCVKCQPK